MHGAWLASNDVMFGTNVKIDHFFQTLYGATYIGCTAYFPTLRKENRLETIEQMIIKLHLMLRH